MSDARSQFDGSAKFADWVRSLRYWLAKNNVPDRGNIKIEVTFPDARSQHYAYAALCQELTPHTMALSMHAPPTIDAIKFEGVTISFTNPERWDRRR